MGPTSTRIRVMDTARSTEGYADASIEADMSISTAGLPHTISHGQPTNSSRGGVTIPEATIPAGHPVRFGVRFGDFNFINCRTIFWIQAIDCSVVCLDAPEVISLPSETMRTPSRSGDRMQHGKVIAWI